MTSVLNRVPSASVLLALLFVASFTYMFPVGLSGDENTYSRNSEQVFFALTTLNFSNLDLVQNAWFPPGMAFLLLPVQLLFWGDAPVWVYRLYILSINVALLYGICHFLRNWITANRIKLFAALLLFSPYYVAHLSTIWSEMVALHAAVLVLLWVHHEYSNGRRINIFLLGVISTVIALVRTLYLPLPLFIALTMQLASQEKLSFLQDTRKIIVQSAMMFVVLAGLVAPWTMQASSKFGPTFLHRGSEMSRINIYADPAEKKRLAEQTGHRNLFIAIQTSISDEARKNGRTFADQSKIELQRILKDVDDDELALRFQKNVDRFYALDPNYQFLDRYAKAWCATDASVQCTGARFVVRIQTTTWPVILVIGIILFVLPAARSTTGSSIFHSCTRVLWPSLQYTLYSWGSRAVYRPVCTAYNARNCLF